MATRPKTTAEKWAEYVKYNPKNAAKVVAADRAGKEEEARVGTYYKENGHIPTLLSRESTARFGGAGTQQSNDLGRQVASGKLTLEQARKLVKEGALVKHDPTTLRAGLDAAAELDPKINADVRKREAAKKLYESGRAEDESKTKAYAEQVANIYRQLQQSQQAQTPAIGQNYDTATAGIAANTQSLAAQIAENYAKANAASAERVAGMGGGTTAAQAQGGQDSAFLQGLAGVQGQGLAGIMQVSKMGALNNQGAAINYTGNTSASTQASALSELLSRANAARTDWEIDDTEYGGEIADLEESRYAKLYENKKALEEAAAAKAEEDEQREFERRLAAEKLGISKGELDIKKGELSIAQQKVNNDIERLGLDRRKIDIDAAKAESQIRKEQAALTPGSIEYMEKQAAINLKRAQAASTLSNAETNQERAAISRAELERKARADAVKASQPVKPGAYGKGAGGVQSYLKDIGADKKASALINSRVSATLAKYDKFNDGLKSVEAWIKKNKPPKEVANTLRRSVGIAYGRST